MQRTPTGRGPREPVLFQGGFVSILTFPADRIRSLAEYLLFVAVAVLALQVFGLGGMVILALLLLIFAPH